MSIGGESNVTRNVIVTFRVTFPDPKCAQIVKSSFHSEYSDRYGV